MGNDCIGTMVCWVIWFTVLLAGLGVLLFLYWPEFGRK